jgi:signal transduction histidine kinase
MSATEITLADLRTVDLFEELTDEQLAEWVAVASPRVVPAGELIAEQGQGLVGVLLLLEGRAQSMIIDGERVEPVGHQTPPTWIGAIAVMTDDAFPVRIQAIDACRLAVIPAGEFQRLARAHVTVHQRVMHQIAPVLKRFTGMESNRERLAALGTMAAGLAHELNNPAAAARRASVQLGETLEQVSSTLRKFVAAGIEREQAAKLVDLHDAALRRAEAHTQLDALDAADAEEELLEQLEDLGVPEPWKIAEPLASAGLDRAWLESVSDLAGKGTDAVLGWVASSLVTHSLVAEIAESTERLSSLVGAVKSYSYMDRGEVVELDVHEGLEATLSVLGYKLKPTQIEIVRDYDRSLPPLMARGPELNQVWTNLLDNAIDAIGERGTITIKTSGDAGCALIEITDSGSGIPADVQSQIFDSFFTTKGVGKGTGLGLATAHRIIVERHDGSLTVDSEPGRTTFHVWIPFSQSPS